MPKTKNSKFKTGVMGGGFNPFHLAHLNSLLTVREQFDLKNIIVIPSFQTPLKKEETASPEHRLKMLKSILNSYPFLKVDDQEIRRKGVSYTHRTITQLSKKKDIGELFFIMGLDQFHIFDRWKNFKDILKKTNLIVTSRPGVSFPKKTTEFPDGLKSLIKKKLLKEISLTVSEKKIYFCPLKDMDISSSDIRQRLKEGKEVSHLLLKTVDSYIKENKLYTDKAEQENQTQQLMDFSIKELSQKKAYDIKSFDLRSKPLPFSFGLIASGSNTRQTKALAVHIKRQIKKFFGLKPMNEEGHTESRWIVLDYGDLVIHIFYDYTKRIYKLDELWEASSPASSPNAKQTYTGLF